MVSDCHECNTHVAPNSMCKMAISCETLFNFNISKGNFEITAHQLIRYDFSNHHIFEYNLALPLRVANLI